MTESLSDLAFLLVWGGMFTLGLMLGIVLGWRAHIKALTRKKNPN